MSYHSQFSAGDSGDTYTVKILNRPYSFSNRNALLIIMAIAVVLRLISAIYQGNTVTDLPGVYDQISYDGLARRVVDGYGFSFAESHWPATRAGEPTAHWSYLYTLYLAAVYKVFGTYPLIARAVQAVIAGVFQTFLVWRIGTRLFNPTVGLIASALNAAYIYYFYYAGALITETFYITCILWTFDASFRLVSLKGKQRMAQWLELGLAIGLTVLLRQVFLLFLPFLFIWVWWNSRLVESVPWKQKLNFPVVRGLALSTIVLVFMILPFTIRNYRAFGTFVLLNTNAGFAFYWGNHPIHETQFMPLLPVTGPSYQDLIPPDLLVLNEGELDKALLVEGVRLVLDDPARFLLLSASRIEEYVKFWPSQDASLVSNISRVGSFGIMLPFMLHGLWRSVSHFKEPTYASKRKFLLIVYLFIFIYAAIHILTWTLIRYRLPIDAFLLIFSALSIHVFAQKTTLQLRRGI